MIFSGKSHNEHGFDCCTFMTLAAPHRWKTIGDFMQDRNDTIIFDARVDDSFQVGGALGLRPDLALMAKERGGIDDSFDRMADKYGWSMWQRKWEYVHYRALCEIRLKWKADESHKEEKEYRRRKSSIAKARETTRARDLQKVRDHIARIVKPPEQKSAPVEPKLPDVDWDEIPERIFWLYHDCLTPTVARGDCFLFGDPAVAEGPAYYCYVKHGHVCYKSARPITIAEFDLLYPK